MKDKNNYTYEAAFKELQEIVQQIEVGDVNIDQLSDYIKRAAILVKICEAKLTETEEEVQILLQKLHEKDTEKESKVAEKEEEYESMEENEGGEMDNPDEFIEEIESEVEEDASENEDDIEEN